MDSECQTASDQAVVAQNEYRGRFVRDLFTGELKEVPSDGGGRRIIYSEPVPEVFRSAGQHCDPWSGTDKVSRPMSLKPEDATPERIERENAAARHHGTGAYYTQDGICHTPTRGSRNREMARPRANFENTRFMDLDAGFGDYAGR